jgi:hypothetical protein
MMRAAPEAARGRLRFRRVEKPRWLTVPLAVVLVFLVTSLATLLLVAGHYPPWTFAAASQATDRRAGGAVLGIVLAAITLHAASRIVPLPEPLMYIASGSYNCLRGLRLMVGVLSLRLPVQTRFRALVVMAPAGAFYLVGNARGLAVLPATLFVVGLIFLRDVKQRCKTWTVIAVCAGLPLTLVIGNTTRTLMGSLGFTECGARLSAPGHWQEVLSRTPVLVAAFHRLFFVGGHSIIAFSPEDFPCLDFSPASYGWELLTRLLPGRLFYAPYYSTSARLQQYGFLITEETSYPMSLGSLYMLGDVVPVILGACAIAGFHSLRSRLIGLASRRSRHLGLFIFSMMASTLIWSQSVDLITNLRVAARRVLSALVRYIALLRPLAERPTGQRRLPRRAAGASSWWRAPRPPSAPLDAGDVAAAVAWGPSFRWTPRA